jgi:hypothetical protein
VKIVAEKFIDKVNPRIEFIIKEVELLKIDNLKDA